MNKREITRQHLREYNASNPIDQFIVESEVMLDAVDFADKLSGFNSNVLILGDSGVGKEAMAKYIHCQSDRRKGPFMAINCSAIPGNLFESEVFGYEKGGFTGASNPRAGLLEAAQDGTVFLDEIGELPIDQQPKFLRFLETRNIIRIGGNKIFTSNARIICATNSNIEEKIKNKEFREDLYYRISTAEIRIPPLRERPEDIMPLCNMFLDRLNKEYGLSKHFTEEAKRVLIARQWPGNVREIRNVIERMMINSTSDDMQPEDIYWQKHALKSMDVSPAEIAEQTANSLSHNNPEGVYADRLMPLNAAIEELEKQMLSMGLNKKMSTRELAEALGVNQSTVVRKLNRYNLVK